MHHLVATLLDQIPGAVFTIFVDGIYEGEPACRSVAEHSAWLAESHRLWKAVFGRSGNPALKVLISHSLLRDNQNHVRCDNQASLPAASVLRRKLHPGIIMSGCQNGLKPGPLGPRLWRLRA
jgi:hypothetical protein